MSGTFDERYTRYQTGRSPLRKLVRRAYLASARTQLPGAVLDFGCGVGELLETLPAGSMGLEYNAATVEYCRAKGLEVAWYDGFQDDWNLSAVPPARQFDSMIVSHVLEHLEDPETAFQTLLGLSKRYVLVSVPREPVWRVMNMARGKYWGDLGNTPGHIQHWSRSGFLAMLRRHAEVVESRSPLPWTQVLCRAR
jgi:SAM-dependent methyltransferase